MDNPEGGLVKYLSWHKQLALYWGRGLNIDAHMLFIAKSAPPGR